MSDNLQQIVAAAYNLGVPPQALVFNPKLARGLDYYTGMIFEGKIPEYPVGSVGGGGRYDNLLNELTGVTLPAVGFGIGFDRAVEAADALGLIPVSVTGVQVMMTVFSPETQAASLTAAKELREAGIATEIYPEADKLGKQFKVAEQKGIPYTVVMSSNEGNPDQATLKDMATGEEIVTSIEDIITRFVQTRS